MLIYLSHPIHGKAGADATGVEMQKNCDEAIKIGKALEKVFPRIKVYVPGASEPFVGRCYYLRYLTEKQILEIDCMIVDQCEAVIVYVPDGDELQGGRLVEFEHAEKNHKPVVVFDNLDHIVCWLTDYLVKGR